MMRPMLCAGAPRPEAARQMGWLWFDRCTDGARVLAQEQVAPAQIAAFCAPRADICGLSLDRPRVMGIINATPDSFSDGGFHSAPEAALALARAWQGHADILDIGGESTRPGADEVEAATEIARVVPVIRAIREAGVTTPISIDTRKAPVAEAALGAGADMVNDVSAFGFDPEMAAVVAQHDVPVCLMHAQGQPKTMQADPQYGDVLRQVYDHLAERIDFALGQGIAQARLIADPGIGFGKTLEHNLSILRALATFHGLAVPLLVGASRKRFIGTLGQAPAAPDRLGGSVAVALHSVAQGAQIVRVHDVIQTAQALRLWAATKGEMTCANISAPTVCADGPTPTQ